MRRRSRQRTGDLAVGGTEAYRKCAVPDLRKW
jgi:hypothetical protein